MSTTNQLTTKEPIEYWVTRLKTVTDKIERDDGRKKIKKRTSEVAQIIKDVNLSIEAYKARKGKMTQTIETTTALVQDIDTETLQVALGSLLKTAEKIDKKIEKLEGFLDTAKQLHFYLQGLEVLVKESKTDEPLKGANVTAQPPRQGPLYPIRSSLCVCAVLAATAAALFVASQIEREK
jgi:hypothetical protein